MIQLKFAEHSARPTTVIEIWSDGLFLGMIYPQVSGIRVVSKYLEPSSVRFDPAAPPVVEIRLP